MTTTPALSLTAVTAGYGGTEVLHDVDLVVAPGSVVALLGPNGAGKTTLLRVASGLVAPSSGSIQVDGRDVTRRRPSQRAQDGLCLIPEGRGVFPALSVRENLVLHQPKWHAGDGLGAALDVFPDLKGRLDQTVGQMSGGQQQMLALARAWLAKPSVVLLDEVSMGLAPKIVDEIFEALARLAATGTALLLVEQYVDRALEMADTIYLFSRGAVTYSGASESLDRDAVLDHYLGAAAPATG